ncbi:MAG: 16S rRNA (cytosine(967)-C(5))-methyltransferase [Microcoleaceae cyanobacterium]
MIFSTNPRQLAFLTLQDIYRRELFADVSLDRNLSQTNLSNVDRRLATELVYGCVRRRRSLDALINQLAQKTAAQQSPDLRIILHLGLYQLGYLTQIPAAAAVNSTVELAKENKLAGLSGFVNGILRQYLRKFPQTEADSQKSHPFFPAFQWPEDLVEKLGILHSFPNWIIQLWLDQLGLVETEKLCQWFNQSPTIDLRINPLKTTLEEVEAAFQSGEILTQRIPNFPYTLRLIGRVGAIQKLPGYTQGWWTVQDSSAQLVSYLLDPKPGELIIDACAAPGGKTTHIAELMQDQGIILAFDKAESRLRKLKQNLERLQLQSIQIETADILNVHSEHPTADRVLLDAPCSGLGTLHRRADARWRHTPKNILDLAELQTKLLDKVASWVKPGGYLVYATCTLHTAENETVIQSFLHQNPQWDIEIPSLETSDLITSEGWIKVWPHRQNMDGFFMVKLKKRCLNSQT